jgi:hypothetical protein
MLDWWEKAFTFQHPPSTFHHPADAGQSAAGQVCLVPALR